MSDLQVIESTLERALLRRRWNRSLAELWRGLLVGSAVLLVTLILYKALPIPFGVLVAGLAVALAAPLGGFLAGWVRKPGLAETARWVDQDQRLQERLSTALEVGRAPATAGDWRSLLLSDAAHFARQLDPRKIIPLRLPNAGRWALMLLALGAGLGFVPEYRSPAWKQSRRDAEVIRDVGQQLQSLTRRDLAHRPPALEPTERALRDVSALGDQMTKVSLTRDQALKNIANVTEKLKQQANQIGRTPAMKMLERAARESGSGASSAEQLQQRMQSMQQNLGAAAGKPDAFDKLKQELEKIQQAGANLPDKDTADGAAMRQQLAGNLADLARQARDLGQSLAGLEEAIAALQANQTDLFLKDLKMAMTDLEKLRDMARALQDLQKQYSKLGKDLAEQLKFGQAEAAQQTLQKMIDLLKSGKLTPEQLQQMMREVLDAVDPGAQYGKVGECLGKAVACLKSSQNPQAALALAEAQKELQRLLDQMGDAESLMATLEALQKAQMCVGNCQGWGQCNRPGLGKGGRPGSGVGTWADESEWAYSGELTERWDNTGLERPDIDPRGITDRGPDQLADNLQSTKLRGQISPGGSMPSITLKGVSIKGRSTVAYEEAVTAAQSEAQSALNQDKVPRAYQGAVRDYFDDLKK